MSMTIKIKNQLFKTNRIFCIGRNYADHARELKSEIPKAPVIFMKPATALVSSGQTVRFPTHGSVLHHEVEVVVLIGKNGRPRTAGQALSFIAGLSLGIDLTLRDVQEKLKKKGLPWEIAKAFDQSALIGNFTSYHPSINLAEISFDCSVDNQVRQSGNTKNMIFPIPVLIVEIAKIWQLQSGDLIYTGTPAGVGPLEPGQRIIISCQRLGSFSWQMFAGPELKTRN